MRSSRPSPQKHWRRDPPSGAVSEAALATPQRFPSSRRSTGGSGSSSKRATRSAKPWPPRTTPRSATPCAAWRPLSPSRPASLDLRLTRLLAIVTVVAAVFGAAPQGSASPSATEGSPLWTPLKEAAERGDVPAALGLAESLAAALEGERAADPAGLSAGLEDVADLLRSLQKPEADSRAESLLLRALRLREEALGRDRLDQTATMEKLSEIYFYAGRWRESEALDRRVLAIRRAALG